MSETENRRREICRLLQNSTVALNGTELAKMFGVSRQVIVQDIAVLKAGNYNIISTNRGYFLPQARETQFEKVLCVSHTDAQIEEELNVIVDLGATVQDVFVSHNVYGIIRVELNIKSRRDIQKLLEDIRKGLSQPLKQLTKDFHYHTVVAEKEEILEEVEEELRKVGFLVEE